MNTAGRTGWAKGQPKRKGRGRSRPLRAKLASPPAAEGPRAAQLGARPWSAVSGRSRAAFFSRPAGAPAGCPLQAQPLPLGSRFLVREKKKAPALGELPDARGAVGQAVHHIWVSGTRTSPGTAPAPNISKARTGPRGQAGQGRCQVLMGQNLRATKVAPNWTPSLPGLSTSKTQRPRGTRIEKAGCKGLRRIQANSCL